MNTRTLACALWMGACSALNAQDWNTAGNTINTTAQYLGCDALSTQPLRLTTVPNQPIQFRTDNTLRMHLTQTLTGQTLNGFTGLDFTGFLGVGDFSGAYTRAAARVHAERNSSLALGYRPMIGEGFLATQGEFLYYGGLLGGGTSGIIWAKYTSSVGTPGVFKFIYTGNNGGSNVAGSQTGLEMGRFQPETTLNEGYFGVGDWMTAGATPDERLDVLNRTIRIRRLVPDYQNDLLDKVVVTDDNGRLHWRDAGTLGGGDCDWVVDPNGTSTQDICTAYNGSPCPWDNSNNVGIGNDVPFAKLDVVKDVATPSSLYGVGLQLYMPSENYYNWGINALVNGFTQVENVGGRFVAENAGIVYGVQGIARGTSTNIGVFGSARTQATVNYGVYGEAGGATTNWAGYFDGRGFLNAGSWVYGSDASLKTGIQDLPSGALGVIEALRPRTYQYDQAAFPSLNLPAGTQYGLVAQEVQAVLPDIVSQVTRPEVLDTTGSVETAEVSFLGVEYTKLIPWLIAGMQEQQQQIATLQAQVASCCAAPPSDTDSRSLNAAPFGSATNETKLTIQPNPFVDRTTLTYTLDRSGQMLLVVTTARGRQVQVLREGASEAGSYTYEWETSSLSSGMYYLTLLLDGEVVTKKAVKL
ncbi:MAG: tail fiber domain-containing protein [Flavobacteriales bacterium]|nr:tail fiber domain-containing protein [Flavobacteriales bacterium]